MLTVWTTSVIQGPEDVYSGGRRTIPQPRNATKYDFDEEPQASESTDPLDPGPSDQNALLIPTNGLRRLPRRAMISE